MNRLVGGLLDTESRLAAALRSLQRLEEYIRWFVMRMAALGSSVTQEHFMSELAALMEEHSPEAFGLSISAQREAKARIGLGHLTGYIAGGLVVVEETLVEPEEEARLRRTAKLAQPALETERTRLAGLNYDRELAAIEHQRSPLPDIGAFQRAALLFAAVGLSCLIPEIWLTLSALETAGSVSGHKAAWMAVPLAIGLNSVGVVVVGAVGGHERVLARCRPWAGPFAALFIAALVALRFTSFLTIEVTRELAIVESVAGAIVVCGSLLALGLVSTLSLHKGYSEWRRSARARAERARRHARRAELARAIEACKARVAELERTVMGPEQARLDAREAKRNQERELLVEWTRAERKAERIRWEALDAYLIVMSLSPAGYAWLSRQIEYSPAMEPGSHEAPVLADEPPAGLGRLTAIVGVAVIVAVLLYIASGAAS